MGTCGGALRIAMQMNQAHQATNAMKKAATKSQGRLEMHFGIMAFSE